jgi:hypothetical protein
MVFGDALGTGEPKAELKEGDGKLVYDRATGAKPPGGKHTLSVSVAATKNCEAGSASVNLVVAPVVQLIEADRALPWPDG